MAKQYVYVCDCIAQGEYDTETEAAQALWRHQERCTGQGMVLKAVYT